jgi:hypothetical protein
MTDVHQSHPDDLLMIEDEDAYAALKVGQSLFPRVPGWNVDPVDVNAGLALLKKFGYDEPHTTMVIEYALQRWGRGEEAAAEKGAIDKSFHGIDYTTWRAVLAAAVAAGTVKLQKEPA